MWSASGYSSMVLGVPSAGSAGAGTAAASIQSHMEKYLTDADSVNDYEGDSDGNSNGDEGDTARCNSRPRSRGVGSSGRLSTTSGHHHVTSGADCKTETFLHSDVLDLHKDGGGSGSGVSSGNADSARDMAGRWTPLVANSPPSSHHERNGGQSPPPHHHHHHHQQHQPMDISSPVLQRSALGVLGGSTAAFLQHRHPRLQSNEPLLDRFRPVSDRFQSVSANVNQHQPVGDVSMEPTSSTVLGSASRGQSSASGNHGHGPSGKGSQNRGVKSYHCRMCEQEFANKSDMQRHAKEAHRMEDKGHKCAQCLKSFPSSQQLAQHSLVHSNVRKYACNFCDKAFKQLSHVQQHQRIHTGERPYRCPVDGCSKAFRQLSSLQQHLKGHNIPLPKSYPVTRAPAPPPPSASTRSPPSSGSPPSGNESSSGNRQLNSSLARPHDLTCQVCEKHCADEVRFFCHIHKYHPDYWRVFSGGRPLSDFIETTSTSSPSPTGSEHRRRLHDDQPQQQTGSSSPPHHREKRFACSICHKRYSHETGYVKHMAGHSGFASVLGGSGNSAVVSAAAAAAAAAVGDLLASGNGNGRLGSGGLSGADGSRVSLYNCSVCSKLFTKEAYLLRHMEMKLDPAHAAGLEELKKSSGMFRVTASVPPGTMGGSSIGIGRPPPTYHGASGSASGFLTPEGGTDIETASMLDGRNERGGNGGGYGISKMLRPDSIEEDDCGDEVDERVLSSPPSNNYVDNGETRRTPGGGRHAPSVDVASARRQHHHQQLSSRSATCVSPMSSASSTSPSSPPTSFAPYIGISSSNNNNNDIRHHHHSTGGSSSSSYSGGGGPPTIAPPPDSTGLLQRYVPLPASSDFLRRCNSSDMRLDIYGSSGYHQPAAAAPGPQLQSPSGNNQSPPRTNADIDDGPGGSGGVASSPEMDDAPPLQSPTARYVSESLTDDHHSHHHHRRSTPVDYYSPSSPYIRFQTALGVPPLTATTASSTPSLPSRVGIGSPGLVGVGPSPPITSFGYPQYYGGASHPHDSYLRRAAGGGSSGELIDREIHSFRL